MRSYLGGREGGREKGEGGREKGEGGREGGTALCCLSPSLVHAAHVAATSNAPACGCPHPSLSSPPTITHSVPPFNTTTPCCWAWQVVHRVGVFEEAEEAEEPGSQPMNEDGPAAAAATANGCSSGGTSRSAAAVGEEDGQSGGIPGIR
jgi:hypothetical protein